MHNHKKSSWSEKKISLKKWCKHKETRDVKLTWKPKNTRNKDDWGWIILTGLEATISPLSFLRYQFSTDNQNFDEFLISYQSNPHSDFKLNYNITHYLPSVVCPQLAGQRLYKQSYPAAQWRRCRPGNRRKLLVPGHPTASFRGASLEDWGKREMPGKNS